VPIRDLADETHARRSLRSARERRLARWRRERRNRGGHLAVVAATGVLLVGAGGAVAHSNGSSAKRSSSSSQTAGSSTIAAVQSKLGIAADGIAGPQTRRAIRRFQRANGLTVDGVIGPQTLGALGISATDDADATGASAPTALLARIAQCESGGDPTAVSPNGRYRGKYQFSRATWRSLGGTGDPAAASEGLQDRMAAKLLASQGRDAWPVCAR
jgi:peptidoglycan hydrolase-like protein with peptidoglycan-binding domain